MVFGYNDEIQLEIIYHICHNRLMAIIRTLFVDPYHTHSKLSCELILKCITNFFTVASSVVGTNRSINRRVQRNCRFICMFVCVDIAAYLHHAACSTTRPFQCAIHMYGKIIRTQPVVQCSQTYVMYTYIEKDINIQIWAYLTLSLVIFLVQPVKVYIYLHIN